MSVQNYSRTQNQALLIKIEAVEGTLETPDAATQAVEVQPFQIPLNPKVLESNAATGSIRKGRKVVTHVEPRLSVTATMRGGATAATAPRQAPLLRVGGSAETTAAVLPATGVFDVASGTATTIVIDQTAGTGTQLDDTTAELRVALVGRPMTLAVNPTVAQVVVIIDATFATPNITLTFSPPLASAAGATTEAVIKPAMLYRATDTIPTLSAWAYRDGKLVKLRGLRGKNSLVMPGGERPTLTCDLAGTFVTETDASVPATIDFTGLPAESIWRNGICTLNNLDTGCSNFTLDLQASDTRYPNPNLPLALDRNIITSIDPGGVITVNDKLNSVHDIVTALLGNTLMAIVVTTDLGGAAGSRFSVCIPQALLLDRQDGDREGIMENQLPYQAVSNSPFPPFIIAYF